MTPRSDDLSRAVPPEIDNAPGGMRTTVETWFGILKELVGQFRRRWPVTASKQEVQARVEAFAWLCNRGSNQR